MQSIASKTRRTSIVMLHGLGSSPWSMFMLASRLAKSGFDVEVLGYRSRGHTLQDMTDQIEASIPARFNGQYDIVAHSLGGLVAHRLCERSGSRATQRMVMLGSPFLGSRFAEIMIRSRTAEWIYGPIWHDLLPQVRAQHDRGIDGVEVGMIAGSIPGSRFLPRGETDGLIRLSATKASMLKEHKTIHSSHAMLLFDREAAEATSNFLRLGTFGQPKSEQAPASFLHQ